MPTATEKQPQVLTELGRYEAALSAAEKRHQELNVELTDKREILHGPMYEANVPGLVEELEALRQRDPVQFKATGEATGPDAKKLQDEIDAVGDLGPLAAEVDHAGRLADKARLDHDAWVKQHALEILDAKRPEIEEQTAALAAALDHLRQELEGYGSWCRNVSGLLGAAGLDTRVPGEDEASSLRRSLKHVSPLPVPIPEAEAESKVTFDFGEDE
jgi:hypothetical protein